MSTETITLFFFMRGIPWLNWAGICITVLTLRSHVSTVTVMLCGLLVGCSQQSLTRAAAEKLINEAERPLITVR